MRLYQVEHELHHMVSWPPRVPTRPTERLATWLRESELLDAHRERPADARAACRAEGTQRTPMVHLETDGQAETPVTAQRA